MRAWVAGIGTLIAASLFSAHAREGSGSGAEDKCATPDGLAELAARLESRQAALDRRDRSISAKEADLRAAEERLTERLAELEEIREEIASQLKRVETEESDRRDALVGMLQSVRPKDGGPILGALETNLAVEVLDRMNTAKAGKLLAELSPKQAANLLELLSRPVEVQR